MLTRCTSQKAPLRRMKPTNETVKNHGLVDLNIN